MGDPPRQMVTRYLKWYAGEGTQVDYHALYHLNVASEDARKRFIRDVGEKLARW